MWKGNDCMTYDQVKSEGSVRSKSFMCCILVGITGYSTNIVSPTDWKMAEKYLQLKTTLSMGGCANDLNILGPKLYPHHLTEGKAEHF